MDGELACSQEAPARARGTLAMCVRACIPFFILLFALAACTLPQPPATHYDAATATKMPACAHAGKPLPLPKSVPSEFPLPAHTAITQITKLRLIGVRMYASIMSSSFDDTVKFFE